MHNANETDLDKKKQAKKGKKILIICCFTLIILVATVVILFLNNKKKQDITALSSDNKNSIDTNMLNSTDSNAFNEEKYQCYIKFNNDIVECYKYSVQIYFNDKGMNETIKDEYEPDKVEMIPVFDTAYEDLEKTRKASASNPKMNIDDDVIKLVDDTQKLYDLLRGIYYVYGGQDFGKKTDKTKEELHKELLSYIKEYNTEYTKFSVKLKRMSIEYMSKDLEKYKKSGDMNSYHTLNIMIKSEKLYEYFIDNNITNENLFNMNLDEYKKLLEDYNIAFSDFEKQNIDGSKNDGEYFIMLLKAYHSFLNNIVDMVNNKNFNTGILDAEKGLVGPDEDSDIQNRLYFYVDRMIEEYNKIQDFKKYTK